MITVYISIGNSDDKMPQAVWSQFWHRVRGCIYYWGRLHGEWLSSPNDRYQNACWCIELVNSDSYGLLGGELDTIAREYDQKIAWAEAPHTEFIG